MPQNTPVEKNSPACAAVSLTNPGETLIAETAAANALETPTHSFYLLNSIGSGLRSAWGTTAGRALMLIGGLLWAAYLVSQYHKGESDQDIAIQQAMTPTQATQALTQMDIQLKEASNVLTRSGVDATTVAQHRAQVVLRTGTTIRLSQRPEAVSQKAGSSFFLSKDGPQHYSSLKNVSTDRYLSSISQSPTRSDIEKNSAAIHGATVSER